MNQTKHDLLARVPGAWDILFTAAAAAHVPVDDIVRAGLSRGGVSAEAFTASQTIAKAHPHLFSALKAWPFRCVFCVSESPTPWQARCVLCGKRACPECVTSAGCPTCRAEQERKRADAKREQADREALLKEALP